jgi:hypothetical protein
MLAGISVAAYGVILTCGGGVARANTAYLEVGSLGQEGTGAGDLHGPTGVAIQQSTGDVYVVDAKNLRVQKFGPNHEFILAFGKEVDETKISDGAASEANVCTATSGDVCKAGTAGSEPGELGEESIFGGAILQRGPSGIAVDPETGDLYVADRYNRRIEKFSSAGAYVGEINGGGTPAGSFAEAINEDLGADAVAVDPVVDAKHGGHDLYVTDAGNNVVDVFDSAGAYLRQLTGSSAGAFDEPDGVAFDSVGDAYVLDRGNRALEKFTNGEGAGTKVALEEELTGQAEAISIDAAGDLFVDEHRSYEAAYVTEFSPTGKVLVREFGEAPGEERDPSGIAVEASGKRAYFSGGYTAGGSNDKVWIFEEQTGEAPLAVTGAASAVGATSADVAGKVDPEESLTEYWFEYGPTEAYGSQTSHESGGDTNTQSEVDAHLERLAPHETYHYRLVAKSVFGEVQGIDKTFTTSALAPQLDGESISPFEIGETEAHLNARINPENEETHYYFQYSTDPALATSVQTIPAPPGEGITGTGEQSVRQDIASGLTPDTTYYFRVVAENEAGPMEDVPIESFTTWPPAPSASTGEASEVTDTTATLPGMIDGMGADTHYYFKLDGVETPNPAEDAGDIVSSTPVSLALTGLSPNTTYHYQLVAYNVCVIFECPPPSQTASGEELALTTLALPPVATADPSGGNISPNSATITGSVDLQGVAGSYHFEYGPTAAYGEATTTVDLGSSTLGQEVSANLSGLVPDTTYHFRLVTTTNGGTDYSPDETLTTYTTAPAVSTGQATSVGSSTATLGGSLDPQGAATSYWFEYGTTPNYSTSIPVPSADAGAPDRFESVTQVITGLTASTTYHFRLVTNNAGGTAYGADETFTTAPPAPAAGTSPVPSVSAPTVSLPSHPTHPEPLTKAQKLARALKACRKQKARSKRAACEHHARRAYASKPKPKTGKGDGHGGS